jgi:hypothetical protein
MILCRERLELVHLHSKLEVPRQYLENILLLIPDLYTSITNPFLKITNTWGRGTGETLLDPPHVADPDPHNFLGSKAISGKF